MLPVVDESLRWIPVCRGGRCVLNVCKLGVFRVVLRRFVFVGSLVLLVRVFVSVDGVWGNVCRLVRCA